MWSRLLPSSDVLVSPNGLIRELLLMHLVVTMGTWSILQLPALQPCQALRQELRALPKRQHNISALHRMRTISTQTVMLHHRL